MSEFENILQDGERLLWSGKPASYTLMDRTNKPVFIRRCILCALICAVVTALYVYAAVSSGAGVKWGGIVVIVAACIASPILFLSRSRKLRKYQYVATDRRLIVVADQKMSVEYGSIESSAMRWDDDGRASLLCGKKAVGAKPGKWREIAFFGNINQEEGAPCEKFAFYAVDDPVGLREALAGKLSL